MLTSFILLDRITKTATIRCNMNKEALKINLFFILSTFSFYLFNANEAFIIFATISFFFIFITVLVQIRFWFFQTNDELMHYFAHPKFDRWVRETNDPNFYTEGFAEYVTRPVAEKLNITDRGYPTRLKAVQDKVAKHISHNDILRAYFAGEVWRLEHESKTAKEEFKKQIKLDPDSEGKKEKRASRSSKGFSQTNSPSNFRFLNFQIESAKLKKQHKKEFKTILGDIKKARKTFTLAFVGHANDFKTKDKNVTLSIARAKSFNQLAKNRGVDVKQIKNFNSPKGVGEANPIAGNQKAIGRAFNRRVDLTVL